MKTALNVLSSARYVVLGRFGICLDHARNFAAASEEVGAPAWRNLVALKQEQAERMQVGGVDACGMSLHTASG